MLKNSPGVSHIRFNAKWFVLNATQFIDRLIPALEDVEVIENW